jgi:hypothetical protein
MTSYPPVGMTSFPQASTTTAADSPCTYGSLQLSSTAHSDNSFVLYVYCHASPPHPAPTQLPRVHPINLNLNRKLFCVARESVVYFNSIWKSEMALLEPRKKGSKRCLSLNGRRLVTVTTTSATSTATTTSVGISPDTLSGASSGAREGGMGSPCRCSNRTTSCSSHATHSSSSRSYAQGSGRRRRVWRDR